MADFTSGFWSWFIVVPTLAGIAGLFWLNRWMSRSRRAPEPVAPTTGHVWDEDLRELNNPLPRWWLNLFYLTLGFGLLYLALYPGLGTFAGLLGWSQLQQYEQELAAAEERFGPLYAQYLETEITALGADTAALATGERLFANYCATCHGSDARGAPGYPNLRDRDWLWGGEPEQIRTTILEGRTGVMPPWGPLLGEAGLREVTAHVLSLSGREHDAAAARAGQARFAQLCAACHGPEGQGNPALGAPNLRDDVWLYGGAPATIMTSIAQGRTGRMPAHGEFLGEAKTHLLAAYVYSLSAGTARSEK